jgi:transcriptional regulator with XRE-family HTH domain
MDTWEVEYAHRTGREVQRLRKAAGLTAQQLGDRAEQLGLKMTRQAISDLENGRRRYVTTAELVILAVALGTPPICLIYPGPYDNSIEIVPGRPGVQFDAAQWFSGIDLGTVPIVPAQESELELGGNSDTAERLEAWRELSVLEGIRGTKLVINDEDLERQLWYDKQIAAMRKRLGLKDNNG